MGGLWSRSLLVIISFPAEDNEQFTTELRKCYAVSVITHI